ncbi:hypothetical protein HN358_01395 [Candidatus Uhrbacteria bacterium]|jgi:hypothetical protein|nr:hypothetical protein [Candidatus Uhrbacteria bacterium]MBT7717315.1 hypothetical protein [Candidatus Uhrbacteria bacterium]
MIKKILIALVLSLAIVSPVVAQVNPIEESDQYEAHLYIFHSESCPHCVAELEFLVGLAKEEAYQNVQFLEFEVTQNDDNLQLFREVGAALDIDISGVPFTIVGSEAIAGYSTDETTGAQIRNALDYVLENGDPDLVGAIITGEGIDTTPIQDDTSNDEVDQNASTSIPESVSVPFFGEVKTANLSLPALSVLLGFIDGFNPCAMWVLVFLISLMIGMKDRKRMWVLGTTFIIASGVVYYFFMAAWLNILLFIGFLFAVRLVIGLVAIGGGAYSIHDYYTNKDAECKVGDLSEKKKTMDKMRAVINKPSFIAAFFGIIALAAAVNMVELVCSAGIPAVFTQILNMADISTIGRYAYMALYILLYMIDDIVVFVIAMLTLQISGVTAKYTRATRLIGGILMVLIGVLMILKPEWLMFG